LKLKNKSNCDGILRPIFSRKKAEEENDDAPGVSIDFLDPLCFAELLLIESCCVYFQVIQVETRR